jgi:BirA family biotin operon repressor/biotin-[acetyl-CoA-carboxylase] ligase
MAEPELTPEAIINGLDTRFIGQKVIYFPTVNSTMDAAKTEAQWGAPAGTVIITGQQTAGKGRLQRNWISPRGALALTVILRPNLDYLPYIVMLSSLAVTYSIEKQTGLKPQIKWPNDVLINEKKVCGILIQNDIHNSALQYCNIGIGINVNMRVQNYPEIVNLATSLSSETGKEVSKLAFVRQLLVEMDRLYEILPDGESIYEQWKNRLHTLGQRIQVTLDKKIYNGIAESVARDGTLLLRLSHGRLLKVTAGDVNIRAY